MNPNRDPNDCYDYEGDQKKDEENIDGRLVPRRTCARSGIIYDLSPEKATKKNAGGLGHYHYHYRRVFCPPYPRGQPAATSRRAHQPASRVHAH